VPEIDLCPCLFDHLNRIACAAQGTNPADPFHDRTEIGPRQTVQSKAKIGPTTRLVDRASTPDERLAWRAAEIDAGASCQSLFRHRHVMASRRCGHRSDHTGWPAAEHHQVVFTASSVGPTRWVALLDRPLVVRVHGE
jgi:hypothetical protein